MIRRACPMLAAVLLSPWLIPAGIGAQENPYVAVEGWAELPAGREWGAVSAVYPDGNGNLWVIERCGQNLCAGTDVDPVLLFDPAGRLLRQFGAGMFVWPHGLFVDPDGNVWATDAGGEGSMGHQVFKFSPEGEVLMTLGMAGVSGNTPDTFFRPSDVLVAPNGDVFVADGHYEDGNNRIVKFAGDGSFIRAWGRTGSQPGEFKDPHSLAMDSRGRLFVGDRRNNRIQIFDQDGNYIDQWYHFGRPSSIFIAADDTIYVADSESNDERNPGFVRGIRIGNVEDARVTAFIPDPEWDPAFGDTSAAEGVAADAMGNVYGAEVGPQRLTKHVRR